MWEIRTGERLATLSVKSHGVVMGIELSDGGRSIAVITGADTNLSADNSLLTYTLTPSGASLRSTIALPAVQGGWGIDSLGSFVVTTGFSTRGGYCCVAAASNQ
jgi:hypothetical protein